MNGRLNLGERSDKITFTDRDYFKSGKSHEIRDDLGSRSNAISSSFLCFVDSIDFDTILFGDMFYSDCFCTAVEEWLTRLARSGCEFRVLIGDPGRSFWLDDQRLRDKCEIVFELDLDESVKFEYPGFHTGTVYQATSDQFLKLS